MGREEAIGLLLAAVLVALWERRRRRLPTPERARLERRDRRARLVFLWFYVLFVAFTYLALLLR